MILEVDFLEGADRFMNVLDRNLGRIDVNSGLARKRFETVFVALSWLE